MTRRTLPLLVVVGLIVGLMPLVASSATTANLVAVTVEEPEPAAWDGPSGQNPWWPTGRGNCDGWEIRNNYDHPDSPDPTLTIEIEDQVIELPAGEIHFVADSTLDTARTFSWRAGPGGWTPLPLTRDLIECHGLAGDYDAYEALFSSQTLASGELVVAEPSDACTPLTNDAEVEDNIALIQIGECDYDQAYENALDAGAAGVIFSSSAGSPVVIDGDPESATIPAVMIGQTDAAAMAAALGDGHLVRVVLDPTPIGVISGPSWDEGANLVGSEVTQTSLVLSWPTADDGDGQVISYTVYQGSDELDTVTGLSLEVFGLTAGTTYSFSVVAHDDIGLHSEPLEGDVTTASLTGPYWPGGAQLIGSDLTTESVRLTWPAALDDDGRVDAYRVYRDGDLIETVDGDVVTLLVEGLSPGTSYHFAVVAVDDDQLPSPQLAASFSTPRIPSTVGGFDPVTGEWHLRDEAGNVHSFFFGVPGDIPIVGDWDCDGVDTVGLYRQSDGYAYIRNSNDTGVAHRSFFFGAPGDIPLAGDFDGDGCDTVSIYRPSEGQVYLSNILPPDGGALGAQHTYYFGVPGDKPFVGDFDGNGEDTIGLHRESTGLVYFRNQHSQGEAENEFYFGNPNDRLVAGDWGLVDGIDTPAVFRPGLQTWYFRHSNTHGNADSQLAWGNQRWLAVAGKFGLD